MKFLKIIGNKKMWKGIGLFVLGMIFGQMLFGGWGDGLIDNVLNNPEIVLTKNIIISQESPELITIPSKIEWSSIEDPKKPSLVIGIEPIGENSPHCLLMWVVGGDRVQIVDGGIKMDVIDEISNSSYPEECDKNKDCFQFSYSLQSNNYKDIEELYGEMCLEEDYIFVSKKDEQDIKCITIEESFVPYQKKIYQGIYVKILDIKPNEEIIDYLKKNEEEIYLNTLLRDKNHKILEHKEIHLLTQDILNCKVTEPI